jgi:hypothetical protein
MTAPNIPQAASNGSDKMHPDAPTPQGAEWKPPTTADGSIDWHNMDKALPPRDPKLGFHLNHEAKRADEERSAKVVEDLRRMEEAKLETARLKAGVALPPPPSTDPNLIVLEWAMPKDLTELKMEYLYDPFLPAKCLVGFYGRGSTAKSTFLATLAAAKSEDWSTLWISAEELKDWITQRHLRAGGAVGTLAVFAHKAVKQDQHGRVICSTFDVYRDLEGSIAQAMAACMSHYNPPRPLRLVVLDTAVGLTTWGKGENANDDGAVKRLLGYLQSLAEQHNLCIAIIGHSNKQKHDHFADTVAGSSAWTNSPRLSFVHAADRREEYAYVMRVAKSNLSSRFAVAYTTEPVLALHQHEDGQASVLCRVNLAPVVWGEVDSMELFEDATRKPEEDSDSGQLSPQKQTLVENAIIALVEMVMATPPDQHVTRDDIERQLGRTVDRARWTKIDGHLQNHPVVIMERGDKHRVMYRRRT